VSSFVGGSVELESAPALPMLPSIRSPELSIVVPTFNERPNVPLLVEKLRLALAGIEWEVIFVDDDSTDGTMELVRRIASSDNRVRGIRRVGRRGLSGACVEGILSSSARFVAIMDGDLQHDEKCLPTMLRILREDKADVVVASRFVETGQHRQGLSQTRSLGSRFAIRIAQTFLRVTVSDPMSGFFMLRREIVDTVAPRLSQQGFKILLDLLASSRGSIRVEEVPFVFRARIHGESKLDLSVVMEYLGLVVAKASGDLVSLRFLSFGLVGTTGLAVHLTVLRVLLLRGLSFPVSQTAAMLAAMTFNYTLNNLFTYRDMRRRGWRFFTGLAVFAALCSIGVVAGVGVSAMFYESEPRWWLAGLAGAVIGAAWNYVTNSAITWRKR
jgi:dolichol-phosphate mannosyltransferase